MKTLDEVITELKTIYDRYEAEGCFYCSFQRECISGYCYLADALHYLKEFKRISARLEKIALGNITETLEKLDNPALTWDELKHMEGKPVWVEDNIDDPEDTTKYWAIYRRIEKTQETEYALLSDFYYDKAQYGETWKAYQKERE